MLFYFALCFCLAFVVRVEAQTCNSENVQLQPFYTGATLFGPPTSFCFSDTNNAWSPVTGRPNARFISNIVCQQPASKSGNAYGFSALFSFFGQALVSHDMNYSEELDETLQEPIQSLCNSTTTGEGLGACETRIGAIFDELATEMKSVLAIDVPANDAWMKGPRISVLPSDYNFLSTGKTCNWTDRSVKSFSQCSTVQRKQFRNAVSPFLDGSVHYGGDSPFRIHFLRNEVAGILQCELLTFDGGSTKGALLPSLKQSREAHPGRADTAQCLEVNNESGFQPEEDLCLGGDVRVNENIGLLSLETVFVREHNRLCKELEANISNVEQRFSEVSLRVAAMQQNIVYQEYLPALLGPNALTPYAGWNKTCSAQVSIWFDSVGFRFGHSEITNVIPRLSPQYACLNADVPLKSSYQAPNTYREMGPDPVLAGLISIPSEQIDVFVVDGLRNLLFGPLNLDLAAINIQRGRERGLCDYNSARELYGLPRLSRFEDITDDSSIVESLRIAYAGNIDTIDPWIGGLAERHTPGATVGSLFSRILIDQFTRTRDCDPNFFEARLASNPTLLQQIRSTSLAHLIRRNSRLECVPSDVFRLPSSTNPLQFANGSLCPSAVTFPVSCATSTCSSWMIPPCGGGIFLIVGAAVIAIACVILIVFWLHRKRNLNAGSIGHQKLEDEPEHEMKSF